MTNHVIFSLHCETRTTGNRNYSIFSILNINFSSLRCVCVCVDLWWTQYICSAAGSSVWSDTARPHHLHPEHHFRAVQIWCQPQPPGLCCHLLRGCVISTARTAIDTNIDTYTLPRLAIIETLNTFLVYYKNIYVDEVCSNIEKHVYKTYFVIKV